MRTPSGPTMLGPTLLGVALTLTVVGQAAAGVDACKLLSGQEVEAATKVKVGQASPDQTTSAQLGKCRFPHADTKAFGASIVASVAIYKPERVAGEKTVWAKFMRATPVSGVGDFAVYNEAAGVLLAGHGEHLLQIQMLDGPAGAGRLAALKALARVALARF